MRQATATGWNNQTAGLWTKPSFCALPKATLCIVSGSGFTPHRRAAESKIRHPGVRCSSTREVPFEAVAISQHAVSSNQHDIVKRHKR